MVQSQYGADSGGPSPPPPHHGHQTLRVIPVCPVPLNLSAPGRSYTTRAPVVPLPLEEDKEINTKLLPILPPSPPPRLCKQHVGQEEAGVCYQTPGNDGGCIHRVDTCVKPFVRTMSPGEFRERGPGDIGDRADQRIGDASIGTFYIPPFEPPTQQLDDVFNNGLRLPPTDGIFIADALRSAIIPRLAGDTPTTVESVLMENLTSALPPEELPSRTQEQLVHCVLSQRLHPLRNDPFQAAKPWLSARFDKRHAAFSGKRVSLQSEYQALHDRWKQYCCSLTQQAKRTALEDATVSTREARANRRAAIHWGYIPSDFEAALDPIRLSFRNVATIPDMVSVTPGRRQYTVFDDTNHLVDNPSEYYAVCTGINDWTDAEKQLILEKYAATPKQFGFISEFLPNKTAKQCVEYYYLHKKKLVNFRRAVTRFGPKKRRRGRGTGTTVRKRGNGLLVDIREHDARVGGDFDCDSRASTRGWAAASRNVKLEDSPQPTNARLKRGRTLEEDPDYNPKTKRCRKSDSGDEPVADSTEAMEVVPGFEDVAVKASPEDAANDVFIPVFSASHSDCVKYVCIPETESFGQPDLEASEIPPSAPAIVAV